MKIKQYAILNSKFHFRTNTKTTANAFSNDKLTKENVRIGGGFNTNSNAKNHLLPTIRHILPSVGILTVVSKC
jgi:hypothetical protein